MTQQLTLSIEDELEDDLGAGEESEENVPFYSITSYGADYPVDGLVRRITDGSIYVPEFQRGFVWTIKQASRFIESLLLGLPVPGIFLAKEEDTQKLLVIDGQQRLRTLQYFYAGKFAQTEQEFALKGVQKQFEGKTYNSLAAQDRRRLDDSIIHATVIRQDTPSEDDSSIYHIFQRLNTGGTLLQPQEIRAAIFHGSFNDLLNRLNENKTWREIYGPINLRMRDQELILRFLALYFDSANYDAPMEKFLNTFMKRNKKFNFESEIQLGQVFLDTIKTVRKCLGTKAFRPRRALNAAVFDAVMVGIARRLANGKIEDCEELKRNYQTLLETEEFTSASIRSTADEESVSRRIRLATQAFANVK